MSGLHRLTYVSRSVRLLNMPDFNVLLEQIRPKNKQLDITGLLLYKDKTFLQVLEGKLENINAVFEAIEHDPRHFKIKLLEHLQPCEERFFPNWSMGFFSLDDSFSMPSKFVDFFSPEFTLVSNSQYHDELVKLLLYFQKNS
ncbi:BLUF domain-containing protein [Alteromonas sp. 5E99-2]|uniref:BLUF domain-containing protein n=1 Tax=Alteromonas sp. 5E99-2 TaxID=2817683 RepID=UPI001A99E3DE|nr:BLUF domain-containing protein [Alteromonas sp. 5E99-2]MBO1256873.1 BLUF domain-containing protein [Alteromonas sp. 5E99-2]